MRKYTPSWSISGKYKPLPQEFSPGPGSYRCPVLVNSPRISIGRAKRKSLLASTELSPGPGAYEMESPRMPTAKIGTGKRRSDFLDTPGPGSYKTDGRINSPSFSLRRKLKYKEFNLMPGPGHYNPISKFRKGFVCTIGKEKKPSPLSLDEPSPASYNTFVRTAGPRWRFTTSPKKIDSKESSPGPGAYNLDKY